MHISAARCVRALFLSACAVLGPSCVAGTPSGSTETLPGSSESGAVRLEADYFKTRQGNSGQQLGVAELYGYVDPSDPQHFANIFQFPNAHSALAILLVAGSRGGFYAGDEVGIYDLSNVNDISGKRLRLDGSDAQRMEGFKPGYGFHVSYRRSGKDTVITVADYARNSFSVSLNALYRWRIYSATFDVHIGSKNYKVLGQGGPKIGWVYFRDGASARALDPEAPLGDLCPAYVVPTNESDGKRIANELPIGDTGYVYRWENGDWKLHLATDHR